MDQPTPYLLLQWALVRLLQWPSLNRDTRRGQTRDEGVALVCDAIRSGIFNDLGSGSNVDICVITKGNEYLRNYEMPNPRTFTSEKGYSFSKKTDGKLLATAAAQLKVFNCADHKKIQRFSGHPGSVRCMIFSEDGKYIISSAVTERYVAVWRIDGSKKKSSCCVLAMDHPAAFLDSRCTFTGDTDDEGLCVFAISEMGVCNFWYGENIDELRDSKPTKISVSPTDGVLNNKGMKL